MMMIRSCEDLIFLLALVLPLIPTGILIHSIRRHGLTFQKNCPWIVLLFIALLINPFSQMLFLGPLDDRLNSAYLRKANAIQLIGKTPSEVEAAFGKAERVSTHAPFVYNGETIPGHVLWEYKPLPWFWMGYRFQVSFRNGVVSSFEGFDN